MNLVLFDLDNTLLAGDSDFEWAQYLISRGVVDREVYESRNLEFFEHYKAGTLDIHAFLDFQLKPLSRHSRRVLDGWHEEFMRTKVRGMMGDAARELVARHRAAGDVCVIITATNSFVTAPIAGADGCDDPSGTSATNSATARRSRACRYGARNALRADASRRRRDNASVPSTNALVRRPTRSVTGPVAARRMSHGARRPAGTATPVLHNTTPAS